LRSTTSSTIKSSSCFHVSNSASSKPMPVGFPICLHSFKRQFRGEWKYSSSADLFRDYRIYVACETEENLPALAHCIGEDNLLIGSTMGTTTPSNNATFFRH
jgi:hypothetical protein